jgi:hypothetical protein
MSATRRGCGEGRRVADTARWSAFAPFGSYGETAFGVGCSLDDVGGEAALAEARPPPRRSRSGEASEGWLGVRDDFRNCC